MTTTQLDLPLAAESRCASCGAEEDGGLWEFAGEPARCSECALPPRAGSYAEALRLEEERNGRVHA